MTKQDQIVEALERGPLTSREIAQRCGTTMGAVRVFISTQRDDLGIQTIKPNNGQVQHFIGSVR